MVPVKRWRRNRILLQLIGYKFLRYKVLKPIAIGVDLGTANTLICYNGKILVNEPSIIAIDALTKVLLASGNEAKAIHEKSNQSIRTIKPLKGGVIADFSGAELMIKTFVDQINIKKRYLFFSSLTMLFSVPTGITEVEKRAVKDSAINAGASEVIMVFEPLAAAIGAGLDVSSPEGILIVDIGGGTTQVAIISLSGIVLSQSIKIAGNAFNYDLQNYFRKEYNLLIGEATAESVLLKKGNVLLDLVTKEEGLKVVGRDLISGVPSSVTIFSSDITLAIEKSMLRIEDAILKVLENSPPELASDIHVNGIYLSGGGAMLNGLKERFSSKLGLKVHIVDDPLSSVIKGTSHVLKERAKYSSIIFN